jgi:type IV secretory pathway TraG/TraD family ATPase VirD4
MIVTEATPGYEAGELYKLTSGWRKMAGNSIYCFNPSDMTSNRINPIDRIRRAPEEEKASLAEKLADLVIMNGESAEAKRRANLEPI